MNTPLLFSPPCPPFLPPRSRVPEGLPRGCPPLPRGSLGALPPLSEGYRPTSPPPFRGSSDPGHARRHPSRFPKPANLDSPSRVAQLHPPRPVPAPSPLPATAGARPGLYGWRADPAHLTGNPPGERSPPMPTAPTRSGETWPASPATIPPHPAPTLRRDASRLPRSPTRSNNSSSPVIPPSSEPQPARTAALKASLIPGSLKPIPSSPRGRTHPMHPRCRHKTEYRSHKQLNTNHKDV